MYNQNIKEIEDAIQKISQDVNNMLSGIARQSFTQDEVNQIMDKVNALLKYSGKVTSDNLLEVSIAVKYFQKLNERIMSSHPSMEDSLCEFYTALLHHNEELRLIFEHLDDEQKIDLTGAIKDMGGIVIQDAIITKSQVVKYLKMKGLGD